MEIYSKLFHVKNKIGNITKDSENPFAKSKYASLPNMLKHINPIFEAQRLLFLCDFTLKDEIQDFYLCKVEVINIDKPEEKLLFKYDIPYDSTQKNPVQGFGSTVTYGLRYVLGSLLGIAFDDADPDSGKTTGVNCEKSEGDAKKWLNINTADWQNAINKRATIEQLKKYYKISKKTEQAYINELIKLS